MLVVVLLVFVGSASGVSCVSSVSSCSSISRTSMISNRISSTVSSGCSVRCISSASSN